MNTADHLPAAHAGQALSLAAELSDGKNNRIHDLF